MPEKILSDDIGSDGLMVGIWAPCRASGVETQTDVSSWDDLIGSYMAVFEYAVVHKAANVCMPALGSTLYWPASKTAIAARVALSELSGPLGGSVVTFVVREKDARAWLDELACFDACPV